MCNVESKSLSIYKSYNELSVLVQHSLLTFGLRVAISKKKVYETKLDTYFGSGLDFFVVFFFKNAEKKFKLLFDFVLNKIWLDFIS